MVAIEANAIVAPAIGFAPIHESIGHIARFASEASDGRFRSDTRPHGGYLGPFSAARPAFLS